MNGSSIIVVRPIRSISKATVKGDDGDGYDTGVRLVESLNTLRISGGGDGTNYGSSGILEEGEEEDTKEDSATETAKRAYLLQQYQYEEIDNEDNDDNNNSNSQAIQPNTINKDKDDTNTINTNTSTTKEEILLQKLEALIPEDRASLADDGANCMRSKYETAEIKKR